MRLVEGEGFALYLAPGEIVRRLGEVGALIAVSAHLFARVYLEVGEKAANESVGNSVEYLPAVCRFVYLRSKHFFCCLLGDKPYKVYNVASKTEIDTAVHIELDVEISLIVLHRAEEELKTAILTRCADRTAFDCSYIFFNGREVNEKFLLVIAYLSLGAYVIRCIKVGVIDINRGNSVPIWCAQSFFYGIGVHNELSFRFDDNIIPFTFHYVNKHKWRKVHFEEIFRNGYVRHRQILSLCRFL